MRLIRLGAESPAPIGFVFLVIALVPDHAAVSLERQHVGRNAVEEPAIVGDDNRAARKIEQGFFQCAECIDVKIIGRLIEQHEVASPLQQLGKVHAVALAA